MLCDVATLLRVASLFTDGPLGSFIDPSTPGAAFTVPCLSDLVSPELDEDFFIGFFLSQIRQKPFQTFQAPATVVFAVFDHAQSRESFVLRLRELRQLRLRLVDVARNPRPERNPSRGSIRRFLRLYHPASGVVRIVAPLRTIVHPTLHAVPNDASAGEAFEVCE